MARPLIEIDETQLESLASIGCTGEEMALIMGCSKDTLERRFAAIISKGRANMRMSLRRTQIKLAEAGNAALAIWLGKQYLDQREPSQTIRIEEVDSAIDQALRAYNLPEGTENKLDRPAS